MHLISEIPESQTATTATTKLAKQAKRQRSFIISFIPKPAKRQRMSE